MQLIQGFSILPSTDQVALSISLHQSEGSEGPIKFGEHVFSIFGMEHFEVKKYIAEYIGIVSDQPFEVSQVATVFSL